MNLFFVITASISVLAAGIMHGPLNATVGLSFMTLEGGNELLVGSTGLAGFVALTMITFLFYIFDRYSSKEKLFSSTINLN